MSMPKYSEEKLDQSGSQLPSVENIPRRKFNTSMEKKVERIHLDSKRLGWSYNDFVVHVLEILTVLHHRNEVRSTAQANDRESPKA